MIYSEKSVGKQFYQLQVEQSSQSLPGVSESVIGMPDLVPLILLEI